MLFRSHRKTALSFVAAACLLSGVVGNKAASQVPSSATNLEFDVPHGALNPETKHYEFVIKLHTNAGDKRTGDLAVSCPGEILKCQPETQKVVFSKPNLKPLIVDVREAINSAEIDLVIKVNDGSVLKTSRALDFGLWDSVESVGSDFPKELMGGGPKSAHLWLENKSGGKIAPTTPVQLTITPRDSCAQVGTIKAGENGIPANFGAWTTIDIPAWNYKTPDTLWVQPNVWGNSSCTVEVAVKSVDRTTGAQLKLDVKPNYGAAFLCCLLGALVQYVIAGMVQVVLATRANEKVSFRKQFVGSNAVEIIEAALKGIIAYLVSYILNTTEIVQFKGADKSSLIGFAIFGFLIGFWQLKPLWEAIKKLSDSPHNIPSTKDATQNGTTL